MSNIETMRIVKSLSILVLFLATLFLLTTHKNRKKGTLFLAAFLLSRAIMLVGFVSWDYLWVWDAPFLAVVAFPFLYLYSPLLYLYTKSITDPKFKFKTIQFLHFLPSVFVLIWFTFHFLINPFEVKIEMIKDGTAFHPVINSNVWMWLQLGIYGPLCIYKLLKYHRSLMIYKSSYNRQMVNWLSYIICAFLIWKAIFLTYYFAGFVSVNVQHILQVVVEIFFLVYALGIIYLSMKFPEIHLPATEKPKYKTSPLTFEDKQLLKDRIETYFKVKKPYLEPDFDLTQISIDTAIPMHHLSQLFSEEFKMSFYDYCNKCRIEEVLHMLSQQGNLKKTILELMFEAGFNSKSVFNTSFKKFMGMTPTEYRRNVAERKLQYLN